MLPNFSLFARLMDEPGYGSNLLGDLASVTQGNRMSLPSKLLARPDWHGRLVNGSDCLQVRERRFDEQGLAVGTPGAWTPFAQTIEGYTHKPGVRNVLRLKRFDRAAAAGGAPHLYVLDLVVESATEKPGLID